MGALQVSFLVFLVAAFGASLGSHFGKVHVTKPLSADMDNTSHTVQYNYLGCYLTENLTNSQLTAHVMYNNEYTVEKCLLLCEGRQNRYAAIANKDDTCYCSRNIAVLDTSEDSLCSRCANDSSRMCGSAEAMALYDIVSVTVAKGLNLSDIDILIGRQHGVDLLSSSEDLYNTVVESRHMVSAVDYHYNQKLGFALIGDHIGRFPLEANTTADVVVYVHQGLTFTVDWVHDHLIWPEGGRNPSIMMSDLHGDNKHTLITLPSDKQIWISDIVVDPYRGLLFWLIEDSLMRCSLDGTDLVKVSKLPTKTATGLTLDMNLRRVYFSVAEVSGARIYFVPYNGSGGIQLHAEGLGRLDVWCLGVFHSKVYYVGHQSDKTSDFRTAENHTSLFHTNQVINHIKLMHPELQKPVEVDLCTHKGCSHHCVVEHGVAVCRCPKNLILEDDNKTCNEDDGLPGFIMVLTVLGILIAILLSAGVLMFICDKLWSQVQPSVVRIADSAMARGPIALTRRR